MARLSLKPSLILTLILSLPLLMPGMATAEDQPAPVAPAPVANAPAPAAQPVAPAVAPAAAVNVPPAAPTPLPPMPVRRGPTLTMPEALALSAQHNVTRDVSQARLDQAYALEQQAYSFLRPTISASGSYAVVSQSDAPFAERPVRTLSGVAGVTLSLFNASAFPGVTAANKNVAAQVRDSRDLRRSLSFAVARGYISIIAAESQLGAALRRRAVAERSVSDARARADAGLASENDATRAKLELAQADLSLTNARQAVDTTRLSLAELMAVPADGPLAEPVPAQIPSRDPATLEPYALMHRDDLLSSQLRAEIQRKLAQQTRLGIVPTLSVTGSYSDRTTDSRVTPDGDPQWTVSLNANWTIYDGGNREAVAAGRDASAREIESLLASAKGALHRDLSTAMVNLTSAESAIEQAKVRLLVAQANAREVQARSNQGLATALELADANASQFEAESDLALRRLDLQNSGFELRRLAGMWPLSAEEPPVAPSKPAPLTAPDAADARR